MRIVLFMAGALILGAVWLSPLPSLAGHAFFAHMTMHMGVVAVAAPLISLGLAGGPFDPVRKYPAIFAPLPASILELLIVWTWHTPALHQAARNETGLMIAEQGMFLVAGLFLWLSAFGGEGSTSFGRRAAGVIGLLLTSMHMTLLGALLALAPRPVYAHAKGFAGMTPLEDQHLGGAIMLIVGGISYLAGGLWLMFGMLRAGKLDPEREV